MLSIAYYHCFPDWFCFLKAILIPIYIYSSRCLIRISFMMMMQVPSYVMLGIQKHEEAPPTPQHPLSAMGDACSRMDLTAIHQILVMTHYKDDEGTNEVIEFCKCRFRCFSDPLLKPFAFVLVVFSRMDSTNEGHVGRKKARRLGISRQRF